MVSWVPFHNIDGSFYNIRQGYKVAEIDSPMKLWIVYQNYQEVTMWLCVLMEVFRYVCIRFRTE